MGRDGRDHAFYIVQDIIVPETQDFVSLAFEEARACSIVRCVDRMLAAIGLDDQLRAVRAEISEIAPHWDLEAEPGCWESFAQRASQMLFRFGWFATQGSRPGNGVGW